MTKRTLWYVCLSLLCCVALVFVVNAAGVKADRNLQGTPVPSSSAKMAKTPAMIAAAQDKAQASKVNAVQKEQIQQYNVSARVENADNAEAAVTGIPGMSAAGLTASSADMANEWGLSRSDLQLLKAINTRYNMGETLSQSDSDFLHRYISHPVRQSDVHPRNPLDQGNDACPATNIAALPYTDTGSTVGLVNNYTTCITNSAPDAIYQYTATSTGAITASLCGSGYDTAIEIRMTGACPGTVQVSCNDDFCGLQSQTSWVPTNGTTYFIIVDGFSSNSGAYTLNVTQSLPCVITCQGGDITEPAGPTDSTNAYLDPNGGCNNTGYPNCGGVVQNGAISCGQTVCGTAFTFTGPEVCTGLVAPQFRDTDAYLFTIAQQCTVRWSARAEFPVALYILDGTCPWVTVFASASNTQTCSLTVATAVCLAPGTYTAWIGPNVFTGVPIGSHYRATLTCSAPCVACQVICQGGDIQEAAEPADSVQYVTTDPNGGCNNDDQNTYCGYNGVNAFGTIACGQTICGHQRTYNAPPCANNGTGGIFRDTDWFTFTTTQTETLRVRIRAASATYVAIITDVTTCTAPNFLNGVYGQTTGINCDSVDVVYPCVPAGTYGVWVGSAATTLVPVYNYRVSLYCSTPCAPCTFDASFVAPGTYVGNTCGAGDNCTIHNASEDLIIKVTIPSAGNWHFSLCDESITFWDSYMMVGTTCCSNNIGVADDGCGGNNYFLSDGCFDIPTPGDYFVTVEGYSAGSCGDVHLVVEPTATGRCCYPTGCSDETQCNCHSLGGTWTAGASCQNNPCPPPSGRCCYGNPEAPSCAENTESECAALNGTWTVGGNCNTPCAAQLSCPNGATFSQPGGPLADLGGGYTSEQGFDAQGGTYNYMIGENYTSASPINGLRWWGSIQSCCWTPCTENPMPFSIRFCPDDGFGNPDTLNAVCSYLLTVTGVSVGFDAFGYEVFQFDVPTLPSACSLLNGWVVIQGRGDHVCGFLWYQSSVGDFNAMQWQDPGWVNTGANLGFCLTSVPCAAPDSLTVLRVLGPGNGVNVRWKAEQNFGRYKVWRTADKNNDHDPNNGADPAWTQVGPAINAPAVPGFQTISDTPLAPYYNYTVTHDCAPLGRCCYGNPQSPSCASPVTEADCDVLSGTFVGGLNCTDNPCPLPSYCAASHSSGCDESIGTVTLNTLNNAGTDCGAPPSYYEDYTGMSTTLNIGTPYTITVLNGGNLYSDDAVSVWVDWNNDYDFTDVGEQTDLTSDGTGASFTGSITPPAGSSGTHRMRVRMGYFWTPSPCGDTSYGETEDYTVIVP